MRRSSERSAVGRAHHRASVAEVEEKARDKMSRETSKAMKRRLYENDFPWSDIFTGEVLDVGSGDDPLRPSMGFTVYPFDLPDGGGDVLTDFFITRRFDCIHGSNVLEHALIPSVMLKSWIACLKPGGYIVATVPDWKLYEKETWPSKWNAGHRSTWSLDVEKTPAPIHCKLPEWLNQFLNTERPCEILLCRLIDTSDHSLSDDVDQTLPPDGAEVFLEFVLKRK